MKRWAWIVLGLVVVAPTIGRAQLQLYGPETIVYDSTGDRYFVSNMNSNYVIQIDRSGSYSLFTTVVSNPYGMTIRDGVLYVGGDRDLKGGITGFDLVTREVVFEHLSYEWYSCLNGVTSDTSGHVYFACTDRNCIERVDLQSGTSQIIASIPIPNAVLFDACHHRLFVTTDEWGSNLYTVDLSDNSVATVPFTFGQYSGLALDPLHNLYVSYFANRMVYRIDSTLTGPIVTATTGHNGPEGICYDRVHGLLCVPNLLSNTVRFVPQQVDVWMSSDSSYGWAPFDMGFAASSAFDVSSWTWDFGDGGSAEGASVRHVYESPGAYEVRLRAVTASGDTIRQTYFRQMACLADSLWADSVLVEPGVESSTVEVTVYGRNSAPVREFRIPVVYDGAIDVEYAGFSTTGCRSELFADQVLADNQPESKRFMIRLLPRLLGAPLFADTGSGPLVRLSFIVHRPASGTATSVSLDGYGEGCTPIFIAREFTYPPVTTAGAVKAATCCAGFQGNINGDPEEAISAADILYLVNFVFKSGPEPVCLDEANVNGVGLVNASDVIYLVNYVFKSGPQPVGCA